AVYSLMFFGTAPFGSLQAGTLAQVFGPTAGVAVGAAISLAFAVGVALAVPSLRQMSE
ncbi:MAG: MFS transporter, partial [Chloroflexi bacterium]|nr:MFS transporter [Chloroflexota bacterium]